MSDTTTELEAAAFRRLLEHLDQRNDVQNIDLMIAAGFCRNCLADWYREAAAARGIAIDKDAARERIYGEPFAAVEGEAPERRDARATRRVRSCPEKTRPVAQRIQSPPLQGEGSVGMVFTHPLPQSRTRSSYPANTAAAPHPGHAGSRERRSSRNSADNAS